MKKIFALTLSAALLLALVSCSPTTASPSDSPSAPSASAPVDAPFADGVYQGTAAGFNGELTVSVTVASQVITDVTVDNHVESPGVSDDIIAAMPTRIAEANSYAVDAITGATFTARGISAAVKDALKAAPAGLFDVAPTSMPESKELSADVVIVGSGMAGLVAAIEASEKGLDVIVLEKLGRIGGSAVTSGGIVYAANSPLNSGTEDGAEALADYWQSRAEGTADYDMLRFAAEGSGKSVEWLMNHGVDFGTAATAAGTSPALRAHNCTTGGAGLITTLKDKVASLGITVLLETPANALLTNADNAIVGVSATGRDGSKYTVSAPAVILATGGYDASKEMKALYAPEHVDSYCMSSCGNTGDAITMGEAVGAKTVFPGGVIGFRGIQPALPFTNPINGLMWIPAMSVDVTGARYQNEASDYPVFYANMLATGGDHVFSIFGGSYADSIESLVSMGYAVKGDTIPALAAAAGFDAAVFEAAVTRFNELGAKGVDDDFGNPAIAPLGEGPYYAVTVQKGTIGSFGGLAIDQNACVLNTEDQPIAGLYAAGECANGQFFKAQYPASGTMLGLCTTFARAAVDHIVK